MKRLILNIYPFLIACYPVLALRNYNILYVDLASIVRTLLIVIIITALIWMLTQIFIFRDWERAGVLTSIAMILILSYGHIHIQSKAVWCAGSSQRSDPCLGRHFYFGSMACHSDTIGS